METDLVKILTKTMLNREEVLREIEKKRDSSLNQFDAQISQLKAAHDPNLPIALIKRKELKKSYEDAISKADLDFFEKITDIKDRILDDKTTCAKYSILDLKEILVGEKGRLFLSPAYQILRGNRDKASIFKSAYEGNFPLTFKIKFFTLPDAEGFDESYNIKTRVDMNKKLLDGSLLHDHLILVEDKKTNIACFMFDDKTPSVFTLDPDKYIPIDNNVLNEEMDFRPPNEHNL